ncbi:MAG: DUF3015 family protein [Pseudohongiella sp.]|uniref:DUF3015 family protein n=1 Tax=Pseudohongiella sp. TaxID=1979412 RepID=UPI0034A045E0
MKINKKSLAYGIAFIGALTFNGVAQAQNSTGTGPNPYRDCGIGAALFPTVNWAAVTSNVIWDVGTTAVISATASPETCQGQYVAAAAFIFETYDALTEEAAKGSGEHIVTMMNILDVEQDHRADLISAVRTEMAGQVSQAGFNSLEKVQKAETFYFAVVNSLKS